MRNLMYLSGKYETAEKGYKVLNIKGWLIYIQNDTYQKVKVQNPLVYDLMRDSKNIFYWLKKIGL